MARVGLRQQDRDVFVKIFMPAFLFFLGYFTLEATVGPLFGFMWKAAYSSVFGVALFFLLHRVLRRWELTADERAKFVEGFLAGSMTFSVAAAIAFAPLISGSPNPAFDTIWIPVGLFVFGFSGGYMYSGLWLALPDTRGA